MRRAVLGCLAIVGAFVLATSTVAPSNASDWFRHTQWRLNHFGCDAGPTTGSPNDHTTAGIIRFQAANWLSQTGTLTDATKAKLLTSTSVHCDNRPVPSNSGTGRRIVISQKQNWIWLVRESGDIAAQGGMIDNPKIVSVGTYHSGSKCGRPAKILHNRSYDLKLQLDYFTRIIACGVGIHRVPTYVGTGKQIHPDWMLGTNMMTSHGCTRVSNETAKHIWYFADPGTKVVVVR
ncbi:L,D-transpeptidase family protein [Nocardioides marmorisolisilvae]|uniref:Murein L,D-transpeptidase n=1 Tax=Nocardioides marmorisolisilvae TaxID=1542737 RepID=A0A3N0DS24_9ACTN|nr:L,D-transpeptidase family protein [Nocardioides marmorisolisilvae]RNL78434.1 murein L,D-transpeptidase [Nocardioides marmorisolisilvae]